MRAPEGYVVEEVLSPGPVTVVATARDRAGTRCVLKTAAVARALPAVRNEAAALRALGDAGVGGVPRLLATWEEGLAIAYLAMSPLRAHEGLRAGSASRRSAIAQILFARLADVHAAKDRAGAPLAMVHGDLSPDNVYVAADESDAAIADFGLARFRGSELEETGAFRGSLLYVAPEVARSEPFDARADDFALSASLLHVATGVPLRPRDAGSPSEAALLFDAGTVPFDASHPWHSLVRKLFNLTVAEALLACLAFEPRDRPRETPRPC